MTDLTQFGVQSYCFREMKNNATVAAAVQEIGLSQIEVCAVHADFNDPGDFVESIQPYVDAGIDIVSLGVQTFQGDEVTERQWFECARHAGARFISAHFKIESFREAIPIAMKLCAEFDIRLAIHCHGGYMFGGSVDVLNHLLAISDERIGICLDTAWCLQSGANPVQWVESFGNRLYGVHYKDFSFDAAGRWKDVLIGTGALDLPALCSALEGVNFAGYAVLEYEADAGNPVPALRECVAALRGLRSVG